MKLKKTLLTLLLTLVCVLPFALGQVPNFPGALYTYTAPVGACNPPTVLTGCRTVEMFDQLAEEMQAVQATLGVNLTGLNSRTYTGITITDRLVVGSTISPSSPATAGLNIPPTTSAPASRQNGDVWIQGTTLRFRQGGVDYVLTSASSTFLGLSDTPNDYAGHGLQLLRVNGTEDALEFAAATAPAHNLLSATHSDTTAGAPVLGDLIYATATPTWGRLPGNASTTRKYLSQVGTGSASAAPIWNSIAISDLPAMGTSPGTKVVTTSLGSNPTTDNCVKWVAGGGIGDAGAACGAGGGSHNLLSATHTDTVAASPVLGDLLIGNSTPAWTKLAGNTTTTRKVLAQTGNGTISALAAWTILDAADVGTGTFATARVVASPTNSRCLHIDSGGVISVTASDCGSGGTGDNVSVNGTASSDANFSDTNPAAVGTGVNVLWQKDTNAPDRISAYMKIFIASGGTHAPGLVPDPGATSGTTKFLREDATWQVPAGSGSLEVKETDGTPDVTGVSIIQVSNGTLTNNGSGNVSITTGGGGGGGSGTSTPNSVRVTNAGNTSVSNNTETAILYDTESYDNGGFHSTSSNTNRLTVPSGAGGVYAYGCQVYWTGWTASTQHSVRIKANGSSLMGFNADFTPSSGAGGTLFAETATGMGTFAAGDYIECTVLQTGGSTETVTGAADFSPIFWMTQISGGGSTQSTITLHGTANGGVDTVGARYFPINGIASATSTETAVQSLMTIGATVGNPIVTQLECAIFPAPGGAASWTFTIKDGAGVDHGSCVITGSNNSCLDNTLNYSSCATCYQKIKVTPSGGPTAVSNAATCVTTVTRPGGGGSSAATWNVLTKTADYTVLSTDITGRGALIVCDTSGAARTITLPAANAVAGGVVAVKRKGANACTVARAGSDTLYDVSSVTQKTLASDGQNLQFGADGTSQWLVQ